MFPIIYYERNALRDTEKWDVKMSQYHLNNKWGHKVGVFYAVPDYNWILQWSQDKMAQVHNSSSNTEDWAGSTGLELNNVVWLTDS